MTCKRGFTPARLEVLRRRAETQERTSTERQRSNAAKEAKADAVWAMRELYPQELEDLKEKLLGSAKDTRAPRRAYLEVGGVLRRDAYLEQLRKDLPGFTLTARWRDSYVTDMGDFNAPCKVTIDGAWLIDVTWGGGHGR